MPRIRSGVKEYARRLDGNLVNRLAEELRSERDSGQPIIYEQTFPNESLRIVVVWDAWDRLPLEDRTEIIFKAYEKAEGREYSERIALASGLTVPESYAAGMLPVQIITAIRTGDSVTAEQCKQAMIQEGASTLLSPEKPQLRFATEEEAEQAKRRLSETLPGSEAVWVITQDIGRVDDWLQT